MNTMANIIIVILFICSTTLAVIFLIKGRRAQLYERQAASKQPATKPVDDQFGAS